MKFMIVTSLTEGFKARLESDLQHADNDLLYLVITVVFKVSLFTVIPSRFVRIRDQGQLDRPQGSARLNDTMAGCIFL